MSKGERILLLTLVLILVAFAISGGWGCRASDSPTAPDTVAVSTSTQESKSMAPSAETDAPAPTNDPPGPKVTIENGVVTIENLTHHDVARDICYFLNGPHPQELALHVKTFAGPGQTVVYEFPEELECREQLQIDVVRNGCANSGDLGYIDAVEYMVPPCGECTEDWGLVSEEWSGECRPTIVGDVQTGCIELGEATYERCGITEIREIRRGCECEQPQCQLPAEGAYVMPLGAAGNPDEECAAYGPYVPVCKTENGGEDPLPECGDADFYVCKQSTWMIATEDIETPCPVIEPEGWSHVTGCGCEE